MTYLEAAIAVLKASRRPMNTVDLTESALRKGLLRPHGKTPVASMSAALYLHARDSEAPTIRRVYRAGPTRAARDSVEWVYVR